MHHEEVEMSLDRAAGEVDDRGRRGQQSERDDRAEEVTVARLAPGQGRGRGQDRDHAAREETVSKSVTAGDGKERDRGHVQPEQEQDRSVPAQPEVVGQRLPVRKPTLNPTQAIAGRPGRHRCQRTLRDAGRGRDWTGSCLSSRERVLTAIGKHGSI